MEPSSRIEWPRLVKWLSRSGSQRGNQLPLHTQQWHQVSESEMMFLRRHCLSRVEGSWPHSSALTFARALGWARTRVSKGETQTSQAGNGLHFQAIDINSRNHTPGPLG